MQNSELQNSWLRDGDSLIGSIVSFMQDGPERWTGEIIEVLMVDDREALKLKGPEIGPPEGDEIVVFVEENNVRLT